MVKSDTIIEYIKERVENKDPISPQMWLDGAMKLNVLIQDETDKLCELEMQVSQEKIRILDSLEKRSVAEADARVEATKLYMDMRKQKSKVEQILEFIRLAKKQAQIQENVMQNI